MTVRICLCTMCGIPASGKSSFCKRLDQDLLNDYLLVHINYDKILLAQNTNTIQLHESLQLQNQDKVEDNDFKASRHQVLQMVEIIIQNLRIHGPLLDFERMDGLDRINKDLQESFLLNCERYCLKDAENLSDVLLLIDDNLYFNSMRYEFYKLARQYETSFCGIFMYSSTESAIQRNKLREGRDFISEDIILNMAQKLEPPDPVKYRWEKYSITVTVEESTNIVFPMIKEAFKNPVQPVCQVGEEEQALSQVACSKNLIHQADLILRQCVGKVIANGKKNMKDVRLLSKQTRDVKEDILNGLKSGHLNIPFDDSSTIIQDASKDENCDLYKYIYSLFSEKLNAK